MAGWLARHPYRPAAGLRVPHPLGDEGVIIECRGVRVFFGRPAGMPRRDVGSELRLLEGSLQHVAMRYGDLAIVS